MAVYFTTIKEEQQGGRQEEGRRGEHGAWTQRVALRLESEWVSGVLEAHMGRESQWVHPMPVSADTHPPRPPLQQDKNADT